MFEIRVAVVGYVSVGKTTVINALFGDEYAEVAMKRTTAVVNSFRISSLEGSISSNGDSADDSSIEVISKKLSAKATLEETTTDNAAFRNSNIVKEKTFDISLKEDLHEMRADTKLVIVDIPGINEAGTSSKYKDYVNENWHTFDIVVLVMDARQGVNTEEQLDLLQLVRNNLGSSKNIPVIVLLNKVDDPYDKEQLALLKEARIAVEKLFGVNNREKALKAMLAASKTKKPIAMSSFPAVLPMSAMHAFVYRCGAHLSFEEFSKMDEDFIDKIGKDSYGRQWHRFNHKKKLQKAFQAVSDEDQCKDGVEASNFDSFVTVLRICIGNHNRQTTMIEQQIDVAVKRIEEASPKCNIGADLLKAHKNLIALGKSSNHLPTAFWTAYKRLKTQAFDVIKNEFSPKYSAAPIGQLFNYAQALKTLQWAGEMEEVIKAAKELVLEFAIFVTESEEFNKKMSGDKRLILGSMLLCSGETSFYTNFGFLRLHLESKYYGLAQKGDAPEAGTCPACKINTSSKNTYGEGTEYCSSCGIYYVSHRCTYCPYCIQNRWGNQSLSWKKNANLKDIGTCNYYNCQLTFQMIHAGHEMKVSNGKIVPVDEEAYKKDVTTIQVPESLDDPEHFGHVFWKCCQLLKEANPSS